MRSDTFDAAEAAAVYVHDFNGSPGAERAAATLERLRFRPSPMLGGVATLSPEGRRWYGAILRSREAAWVGCSRLLARVRRKPQLARQLRGPWAYWPKWAKRAARELRPS